MDFDLPVRAGASKKNVVDKARKEREERQERRRRETEKAKQDEAASKIFRFLRRATERREAKTRLQLEYAEWTQTKGAQDGLSSPDLLCQAW
ncbi:hypothetical protein HK104_009594, partial [Borealophlyctis nickersoniae]